VQTCSTATLLIFGAYARHRVSRAGRPETRPVGPWQGTEPSPYISSARGRRLQLLVLPQCRRAMESTRPKALPAAESSTDPQDLPLRSYHLLRSSLGRLTQAVKNHWNRIMAELLVVFENSNLFSKRSAPTKDRFWHAARATRPIIQPCRSPESGSPSPAVGGCVCLSACLPLGVSRFDMIALKPPNFDTRLFIYAPGPCRL
jgi:hypothetical protein